MKLFDRSMNLFRLTGDLSHLLAILMLLWKIWKTRSCAGLSGKSQILFALVFSTRYLDLVYMWTFISMFNTVMKVIFLVCTYTTVYLMLVKFKETYDSNHDTFRIKFLLIPVAGLACFVNYEFSVLEILWAFSIYLESVAILPQLYMIPKTGEVETIISRYLFALGAYRALYIVNWLFRYYTFNGSYDSISIAAGCVQLALYFYGFGLLSLKCSYFLGEKPTCSQEEVEGGGGGGGGGEDEVVKKTLNI